MEVPCSYLSSEHNHQIKPPGKIWINRLREFQDLVKLNAYTCIYILLLKSPMAMEFLCMELFNSHTALLLGCRKLTFMSSLFAVKIDTDIQINSAMLTDCPTHPTACMLGKCGSIRKVSLEFSRSVRHESLQNALPHSPGFNLQQQKEQMLFRKSMPARPLCHPYSLHSPGTPNWCINNVSRNFSDYFLLHALLHMFTEVVAACLSKPFLNLLKQKAGTVSASSRKGFLTKYPRQWKKHLILVQS